MEGFHGGEESVASRRGCGGAGILGAAVGVWVDEWEEGPVGPLLGDVHCCCFDVVVLLAPIYKSSMAESPMAAEMTFRK